MERYIHSRYFVIAVAVVVTMLAMSWVYFKILQISKEKNLVDNPNARKLQQIPVPVMGGVSVFFGVLCGTLAASCFCDCMELVPILAAMGVLLYVGTIDDLMGLTPASRFIIETLVVLTMIFGGHVCIDSLHGLWGIYEFSWWIAVPLTLFATLGIINAINMIDGVNGLSSGLCIACCIMFGIAMFRGRDLPNAMLAFSMSAGLFPFLIHNVLGKSSKMFIGDAGTMLMGVLVAWFVMQMLRSDSDTNWTNYVESNNMSLVALSLAILSVPVFDTLRVMASRMVNGRSPFSADRNHLHHLLYDYGQSHALTSLIEILFNVLVCLCWAVAYKLECSIDVQLYVVIVSGAVLVWGADIFLKHNLRLNTGFAYKVRRCFHRLRQGEKDWWLIVQREVDTPRIGAWGKELKNKSKNNSQ